METAAIAGFRFCSKDGSVFLLLRQQKAPYESPSRLRSAPTMRPPSGGEHHSYAGWVEEQSDVPIIDLQGRFAALGTLRFTRPTIMVKKTSDGNRALYLLIYLEGLTRLPLCRTSKCTCGPVERPVEPIMATCCPFLTVSPTSTRWC